MADEFMSRKARREAERRAAEQAFEARQSSGQPGQPPADTTPVQQTQEPAAQPAAGQQAIPSFDAAEVPPVRHERGPLAADRPVEEAPPQTAANRRRYDDASAPVREAERQRRQPQQSQPVQQHAAAQPQVQEIQSTPSPSQPVPSPPKPEHAPPPSATDLPAFATRAERRRYLREHGLVPAPADAATGESAAGTGESAAGTGENTGGTGPTAQDNPAAASDDTEQAAAMTPRPPAPPVEERSAAADQRPYPSAPARQATASNLAGDLSDDVADERPHTMSPGAYATSQPGTPAAPGQGSGGMPVEHIGTQRMSPEARPDAVVASPPAATQPAASPLPSARPMPTPSAQQTAAPERAATATPVPEHARPVAGTTPPTAGDADLTARRQRRAPVVKPPQTEGIRVVTGATQLARTQAAIDEARRADDAQTPTASGTAAGTQTDPSAEPDDHALRLRASGPMTTPIDAIPQEDLDKEVEGDAVESWDAPDAGEGDELASPPAPPMSARQITHEDGDILYDGEPSKLPFIVLGGAGVAALILIIFALILIF
ncbi:hypothetical protein [Brevibacterium luteolum]|uniref:Uncharacterized protein n=1 Tax=Brevibacterium luteolum TaxID=199591 RepID=A0A849B110_9MICO|nr:hypothetical protein [Brevibacterium luteolum]MBM7528833.1 hypothetical protein [Brevibacterium luteolum]NNG78966.1 hypothetical protein [Brevibacterium luteolum]